MHLTTTSPTAKGVTADADGKLGVISVGGSAMLTAELSPTVVKSRESVPEVQGAWPLVLVFEGK